MTKVYIARSCFNLREGVCRRPFRSGGGGIPRISIVAFPFLQFFRGLPIAIFVSADFLQYKVKKVIISDYSITAKLYS